MFYKRFNIKSLVLFLSLIMVPVTFCMEERPAKRQKNEFESINLDLEKIKKKLASLKMEEIKDVETLSKFSDLIIAYLFHDTGKIFNKEITIFNNNICYGLVSDANRCCSCGLFGHEMYVLNLTNSFLKRVVVCKTKIDEGFQARLLTLEEIKEIRLLVENKTYEFSKFSLEDFKKFKIKLKNLLPEEIRYIRKKLYTDKLYPVIRQLWIANKKEQENKECFLILLPTDIIKIIIEFLKADFENEILKNGNLELEY